MRVADYVVQYLEALNINHSFMITGRGSLFLNDAFAKSSRIKHTFPHHEQSAAFAAAAAAALSGKLQVVLVSTGCASTNCITGVLSAWQDNLPVLFISGQNKLLETTSYTNEDIRTYGQQEANIISLISSITKYSAFVERADDIKTHLDAAISEALSGVKGPVWLDIPIDIQNAQISDEYISEPVSKTNYVQQSDDGTQRLKLKNLFSGYERPVFLIGSGVREATAAKLLRNISDQFSIPIVYTHSAVDILPLTLPNVIGSLGAQGCTRSGAFAVQNADLLIVIGSRMNTLTTGEDTTKFAREADIYAIDIDLRNHNANQVLYKDMIKSDAETALVDILHGLNELKPNFGAWMEKCVEYKNELNNNNEFRSNEHEIDLYQLARDIPDFMTDNGVLICDSGFIDVIVPTNAPFKLGQRCIRPVSQGAMGFALPAILGVNSVGAEEIVCVVGDGSIMFNIQELETIAREKINVKILVITNGMYAVIKRRQQQLFRNRTIGVDVDSGLTEPDFESLSNAFGIPYTLLTANNYLEKIKSARCEHGPQIFELIGKKDQQYIEMGYAKVQKRRFAHRPIEDQKPFIERSVFQNLMIVTPIDQ